MTDEEELAAVHERMMPPSLTGASWPTNSRLSAVLTYRPGRNMTICGLARPMIETVTVGRDISTEEMTAAINAPVAEGLATAARF